MSGLVKAKKHDWKNSNLALFGSNTEKQINKETEPAWEGAGQKVGLKIWRIVNFKVTDWPEKDYGSFFDGDTYIILNTYKEEDSDVLQYDVHFWIGKTSTPDEYGAAAYKTVQLDTILDDKPVQHREVQGQESALFKSYFKELVIMKGGAETAFSRVLPEAYKPRLFRVSMDKHGIIVVTEIPTKKSNLSSTDVFLLDLGKIVYQYDGKESCPHERLKAVQHTEHLKSKREGCVSEVLDEEEIGDTHPFMRALRDGVPKRKATPPQAEPKKLYRLRDNDFEEIKTGEDISKADLKSDDVFMLHTGEIMFVWVGSNASKEEKKNGIPYASNFLNKTETPFLPITVIAEGQKSDAFDEAMTA